MEFKEFNLHPDLQRGLAEAGYIACMPVQEQVLTNAFGGQDLYVQSQTGTGKTAAFLVMIFQRLLSEEMLAGKKALIMAPTRELAVQIEEEAKILGKYLPFKTGSFYGGVGYAQQEKLLRENVQIMVGTPGRVLDLNKSGRMNLMDIAFLVLDEADRMFDMGFYPDLRKLIRVVPSADRRQTMLFSATLNAWVKNLAWEYTKSPVEIEIEPEIVTVDEVEQILYHVPSEEKMKLLLGILERENPESAVVFCNTKRYTEIVAKRLKMNGYECEFIIGDLPQVKRLKVIDDVKAGKIKFLAATDVAARGLDIEGLAMVINYDLPVEAENYVHRIGRTARAGKTGKAITLASEQDVYELPAIERYIGKKIPSEIAVPELFAEDKSAGQHIRAEYYEDRGEDRRLHGNAKAGEGRGARPHGQDRGGGDSRGKRRDTRKPEGKRRSGEPAGKNQKGGALPGLSASGDLSRMTFEERMALYKKKYSSAAPPIGKNKGGEERKDNAAGERRKRGNQKKRRDSRNAVNQTAGQKTGGISAGGKKSSGADRPRQKNTEVLRKKPEQAAPAKKGIISRLLGIFRKK